jgi:hypothetical protein
VPASKSYDYAIVRVVPRVERGEFINAGVIVFCSELAFLDALVSLDEGRLMSLDRNVDIDSVRAHLQAIPKLAAGGPDAGPIGKLTQRERFHWLVSPRSTIVQISPVHTGRGDNPPAILAELLRRYVVA